MKALYIDTYELTYSNKIASFNRIPIKTTTKDTPNRHPRNRTRTHQIRHIRHPHHPRP